MAEDKRSRSGEHRTYRALFSVERARWDRFGRGGTNRAEILRAFIAWWNREPGAKLPKRPPEE